jgi:hypothetical protein
VADAVAFQIANTVLALLTPLATEVELSATAEPDAFPALQIDDDGETITDQEWQVTRCRLLLSVVGYVLGAGAEGHRLARNLDAEVIAALMADQTLGGLATKIELGGAAFERVKLASKPGVTFRRQLDIDFSFKTTDPTVVGG